MYSTKMITSSSVFLHQRVLIVDLILSGKYFLKILYREIFRALIVLNIIKSFKSSMYSRTAKTGKKEVGVWDVGW